MSLVGQKIQRIQIQAVLGEGGMGEVYSGYDEKLARQVAVKRIRSEQAVQEEFKARFLREARILSQLQHPGICAIHDILEQDGDEYLVLELIQGQTLTEVMRSGGHVKRRMAIAESIAAVLEAAHAEGIVHRDLKPDNVMITPEGEVKILDFGVAMVADQAEEQRSEVGRALDEAVDTDSSVVLDQLKTQVGSVVGTLRYMSPEQARGERTTAASDIYSFGLMLQQLFARWQAPEADRESDLSETELEEAETIAVPARGRRAKKRSTAGRTRDGVRYPAEDRLTLLDVALGQRPPVRGLPPRLTRLVESMRELAPAARPNAISIARELRRIRELPRQRLRNALVAAAILLAIGSGVLYTIGLGRERRAAIAARNQAENLVSFMIEDLSDGLEPIGRLELLDQVADQATEYYDSVPAEDLVGETLYRRGLAFVRVAAVRRFQNDLAAAGAAMRSALRLHTELVEAVPDNEEWRGRLATDHRNLAEIELQQGNLDAARAELDRAQLLQEDLMNDSPGQVEWAFGLATTQGVRGELLRDEGDVAGAREQFSRARDTLETLLARAPESVEVLAPLAQYHAQIGGSYRFEGRLDEALRSYQRAEELTQLLLDRDSANAYRLNTLVNITSLIGKVQQARGDYTAAIDSLERALAVHGRLAQEDPTDSRWQGALAWDWGTLAQIYADKGDRRLSREARGRARGILRTLVERDPTNADWRSELSWESLQYGLMSAALGDRAGARAAWRESEESVEEIGDDARPDALAIRVMALIELGEIERAGPLVEKLSEQGWDDPEYLAAVERAKLG